MMGSPKFLVALVLSVAVISCGVSAVPRGNNNKIIVIQIPVAFRVQLPHCSKCKSND